MKHIKPEGAALRDYILTLAARPQGFSLKHDRGERAAKPMETVCVWLVNHGQVIKAKHGFEKRYFVHQADAEAFITQRQPLKTTTSPGRTRFSANAEIVYTNKTRITIIQTPPPRFVAVARLHFQH